MADLSDHKTKIAIASGVVILACIVWIVYNVANSGGGNIVIAPPDSTPPEQQFISQVIRLNGRPEFQRVDAQLIGDKVVVAGAVTSTKDLEALKGELKKIEPKVAYEFNVSIGAAN